MVREKAWLYITISKSIFDVIALGLDSCKAYCINGTGIDDIVIGDDN